MRKPTMMRDDGSEVALPFKWIICDDCQGHGKSSSYLGVITESDRSPGGIWEDRDQFDRYMAGGYDRTCDCCEGLGRVMVADLSQMSKSERAEYRADRRAWREIRDAEAAERRAGC